MNDGLCRKNKITSREECVCKENFSGDRCEIRYQPRSQQFLFWMLSVAGVVILLIIIVFVIGMISLRFNRPERKLCEFYFLILKIIFNSYKN